jgi:hypothetical protein
VCDSEKTNHYLRLLAKIVLVMGNHLNPQTVSQYTGIKVTSLCVNMKQNFGVKVSVFWSVTSCKWVEICQHLCSGQKIKLPGENQCSIWWGGSQNHGLWVGLRFGGSRGEEALIKFWKRAECGWSFGGYSWLRCIQRGRCWWRMVRMEEKGWEQNI